MTSRFSTLQHRDAKPVRAPEPAQGQHQAVVIPTTRKMQPKPSLVRRRPTR